MTNRPLCILVVLPQPMGDAVLATPALRRLRAGLPGAHLTGLGNTVVREVLDGLDRLDAWRPHTGGAADAKGHGLWATARLLRRESFDAAILFTNSFRSALLSRLAGIPRRIGYDRDGRGGLLTDRVRPIRLGKRYAVISMLDYYDRLVAVALNTLGGESGQGPPPDHRLELAVTEADRRKVDALWRRWGLAAGRPCVILVPGGAFGPSKLWPAERFAELADRFRSQDDGQIILSCAPNERERHIAARIRERMHGPVYDLSRERLGLGGLKEVVRRCDLMVANDTGPCHLAAAFGVPLVSLFGPTDPRWTATGYDREIRLRTDVDCGPCQQKTCRQARHRCLEAISVDQVYQAAKQLWDANEPRNEPSETKPTQDKKAESILPAGGYFRPFEESFRPLPDGDGLVHGGYESILRQTGLLRCEDALAFQGGRRLDKPGLGHRRRIRIELAAGQDNPVAVYLKSFGQVGLRQRWVRRLTGRGCEGMHEFAITMTLAEKGIPVARPIAFGRLDRSGRSGRSGRSYVMLEELPGADALERLLVPGRSDGRDYELLADRKRLGRQAAILVRRLHQAGWFHRDLYLAHLFLSRDGHGRERLNLIDLQRVFRPLRRRARWRVKDLAQLGYSAGALVRRTEMLRFFLGYLQHRRLGPPDKRLARSIGRKMRRIARHDARRVARQDARPDAQQRQTADGLTP